MRRYLCIGGLLLLCALTVFRGNAFAQDDAVVAQIGDKKITVSDFDKMMGYFGPEKKAAIEKNGQLKESFLRQIVQAKVISDLARARGFDKAPGMKEELGLFTDNFLANEYIKREVVDKIAIPENELKSYYDSHQEEFKTPEMVRARHILIRVSPSSTDQEKKKAREKTEEILAKIKKGEDFEKLATQFSEDPGSKQRGGDLGFFPRGRMVKSFEDAAFSLKPGEVSGIVETQFGFHIIKLEEKKEAGVEPFETAREKIRQKLLQEKMKTEVAEFINESMKAANAQIYPEVLSGEKQ